MPNNASSDIEICVVDTLMSEQLMQVNCVHNSNLRLLDLIFTNNFNNVNVFPSASNILPNEVHHKALEIVYEVDIDNSEIDTEVVLEINFKKANFPLLNDLILEVDWKTLLNDKNIGESVYTFYAKLFELFNQCVPHIKTLARTVTIRNTLTKL